MSGFPTGFDPAQAGVVSATPARTTGGINEEAVTEGALVVTPHGSGVVVKRAGMRVRVEHTGGGGTTWVEIKDLRAAEVAAPQDAPAPMTVVTGGAKVVTAHEPAVGAKVVTTHGPGVVVEIEGTRVQVRHVGGLSYKWFEIKDLLSVNGSTPDSMLPPHLRAFTDDGYPLTPANLAGDIATAAAARAKEEMDSSWWKEQKLLARDKYNATFEMLTPMLVMPFAIFKAQGRIVKSVKAWRNEALEKGWLVEYDEASGKIAIFISHTWWDREFTDASNDPNDPYDKGAPDYQVDYSDVERDGKIYPRTKDLKFRIICDGVERLCEEHGLNEDDVSLWIDWQSIYQDDKEMKLKGVMSLIKYATMCPFMLIPTDEEDIPTRRDIFMPKEIPGYGSRGWCRVEFFIFALLGEINGKPLEDLKYKDWDKDKGDLGRYVKGTGVQLFAIGRDKGLKWFPMVQFTVEQGDLPSHGALSNPADVSVVQQIENQIIDAFGNHIPEVQCMVAKEKQGNPDLTGRLLGPQHLEAVMAAAEKHKLMLLDISENNLGPEGVMKLAEMVKANPYPNLKMIRLDGVEFDSKEAKALQEAWGDWERGLIQFA